VWADRSHAFVFSLKDDCEHSTVRLLKERYAHNGRSNDSEHTFDSAPRMLTVMVRGGAGAQSHLHFRRGLMKLIDPLFSQMK